MLGDTDSERYFALITKETDAHGGDVGAGITAAASWIAERLPVSALNAIVARPGELWALRYPGQHALHILERPADPGPGEPGLHVRSATSSVHVPELDRTASVVIASEQLDGESGWQMLAPGELVHVRPDLSVHSQIAIPQPPAHLVPLPQETRTSTPDPSGASSSRRCNLGGALAREWGPERGPARPKIDEP